MKYNWQQSDWPDFRYDLSEIEPVLFAFAEKLGHVNGMLQGLPNNTQTDTVVELMVTEAIKTSEIEGEYIDYQDVKSSIRNKLGLNQDLELVRDKRAKGAAELMLAVRDHYHLPLTKTMLFKWHSMLLAGTKEVKIGQWRTHKEAMQIVSGVLHKPTVHFEAPSSAQVPEEMDCFIKWFNSTAPDKHNDIKMAPIRSAIAHLYFESIHPFEDGNGRIGRAISEKALSQGLGRPVLLSLSKAIESDRKAYYGKLEDAQTSNDITEWVQYFVEIVYQAQEDAEIMVTFVLQKAKYFHHYRNKLSDRQLKVINRMFKEGPGGFKGGMSAKKYISITGVSKATATRDLQYLAQIGALLQVGGGRSVRYNVNTSL